MKAKRFVLYLSLNVFFLLSVSCSQINNQPNSDVTTTKVPSQIQNEIVNTGSKLNNDNITSVPSKTQKSNVANEMHFISITKGGKFGYIDTSGNLIIEPKYEEANSFYEGLARVKLNGKYGFIDNTGKIAIETKFNSCGDFHDGLAGASIDGIKSGYIDKNGEFVIEPQYLTSGDFSEGLATVKIESSGNKFIDKNGKFVIEKEFVYSNPFSCGLACVIISSPPDVSGYINKKGDVQIKLEKYPGDGNIFAGTTFSENLAFMRKLDENGSLKWILIDTKGERIGDLYFDDVRDFSVGIASVRIGDKWGAISKDGKIKIQPKFDYLDKFTDELAAFEVNGKNGFVDINGNVVIQPQYDGAMAFENGVAKVMLGKDWGCIDRTGKVIWKFSS